MSHLTKCQCPNHDQGCRYYATGNHYINMTVPVCRECFIEDIGEDIQW